MPIKSNKNRINFYLTDRVYDMIKAYADELGMNNSAFVSMCVVEYVKNDNMLKNMMTIKDTIQELQTLKDSQIDSK